MWSQEESAKGVEVCPIIFAPLDAKFVENKLEANQARAKVSKAIWLIGESSIPGLLMVSYFDQKKQQYDHIYVGRVNDEWGFASANDNEVEEFIRQAKDSFKENANEESAAKLTHFLAEYDFDLTKLLKPTPKEASQALQYVSYIVVGEENTQVTCELY